MIVKPPQTTDPARARINLTGAFARPVLFVLLILWLELCFRFWIYRNLMNIGTGYSFAFALPAGIFLFVISSLFPEKTNKVLTIAAVLSCTLLYAVQTVYYGIFRTFLSIYSISGASQILQFWTQVLWAVWQNIPALLPMFAPFVLLMIFGRKKLCFERISRLNAAAGAGAMAAAHLFVLILMILPGRDPYTPYNLYYETFVPELSVQRLGLITTTRLDLQHLLFGFEPADNPEGDGVSDAGGQSSGTPSESVPASPVYGYNALDIDFKGMAAKENNEALLEMHKYFRDAEPTRQNKYTGLFKGCNLILITAESFSHYLLDKDLMPALYKLSSEGFTFGNFYNPIWGVSTSDGEYAACTGLIPKSGVWSLYRSGEQKNWLPFVLGNQFKSLGYPTFAYHDHTYTYYKRHISHPNMGYEYKAFGNGLDIKKTWPESDLEMMDVTTPEYMGETGFHVYYMTVSGHMDYTFSGNYMAYKNRALVEDLPYSGHVKAYLACNIELDRALGLLLSRLEKAGIAENTVIALSADHYPYGLSLDEINELAGHEVEKNFELYKSAFLLYKKGMEPVTIDKACSSLDILPTLSNLFGLEYDSRLLMGRDILSDSDPLVIFSNRSWITDKARYNSYDNTLEELTNTPLEKGYALKINAAVSKKFKYSAKILDNDYYRMVLPPKD